MKKWCWEVVPLKWSKHGAFLGLLSFCWRKKTAIPVLRILSCRSFLGFPVFKVNLLKSMASLMQSLASSKGSLKALQKFRRSCRFRVKKVVPFDDPLSLSKEKSGDGEKLRSKNWFEQTHPAWFDQDFRQENPVTAAINCTFFVGALLRCEKSMGTLRKIDGFVSCCNKSPKIHSKKRVSSAFAKKDDFQKSLTKEFKKNGVTFLAKWQWLSRKLDQFEWFNGLQLSYQKKDGGQINFWEWNHLFYHGKSHHPTPPPHLHKMEKSPEHISKWSMNPKMFGI